MKREPVAGNSVGPLQSLFSVTFFDEAAFIPCGSLRIADSQLSTQEYEACLSGGPIKHESWLFHILLVFGISLHIPFLAEI
jgi:hypothetical protein